MWLPTPIHEEITISNFYTFFEIHHKNGFNFPGETHDFWECVYILSGSICVSADERIYTMKKGEIIFHKPLEFHKFYVDDQEGATLLIFTFSATGSVTNHMKNKVFQLTDDCLSIMEQMLSYIHKEAQKITLPTNVIYHQQYMVLYKKIKIFPQMVRSYIYQLLLLLTENSTISPASTTYEARLFHDAVSFMTEHLTQNILVKDIALFTNTSETSLKRIFHKYTGISIHKYFLMLKINKAMELLSKNIKVTAISDELGFSNQSNFSTAFKKQLGMSPTEFKNRLY